VASWRAIFRPSFYVSERGKHRQIREQAAQGVHHPTPEQGQTMNPKKVFLYGELQTSIPFSQANWREINVGLKQVPGLLQKTWLSGIGTNTVGGLYVFDSIENARAFAVGPYAQEASQMGASLTVKLFDGDVVEEASRDMKSPHYSV